jgi:hypothetical protein
MDIQPTDNQGALEMYHFDCYILYAHHGYLRQLYVSSRLQPIGIQGGTLDGHQ